MIVDSTKRNRLVLAVDSLSGLAAGGLTWLLAPLLQSLHLWSPGFTLFIAFANLGYGLYSGALFLFFRSRRAAGLWPVAILIAANGAWAIQCFFQAWRLRAEASGFGLAHLVFEGGYVGAVAYVEAKVFFFPKRNVA